MKTIKRARFMPGWLQEYVDPTDTVMDFGCGLMVLTRELQCAKIYGFDVWQPYINQLRDDLKLDNRFVFCKFDVPNDIVFLGDNWADVSITIDVVEHFDKPIALFVIKQMERVSKKRVVIFTPLGFMEQEDGKEGSWGAGNPEYQKHRCGFTHEDFWTLGYETIQRIGGDHVAILAVKEL
uniref:Putative methyltransferase n=1 Tax=viral metagenome TaxID=1070528 RepID=A0A6M3IXA8_9ZZZZ